MERYKFYRSSAKTYAIVVLQSPFGSTVGLEGVQLNNGAGFSTGEKFKEAYVEISWENLTPSEKEVFRKKIIKDALEPWMFK